MLNTTDEISDKSESPEVLAIYVRTFYYSVKDFRYSSLTCAKFDLTVSKLVLLNWRLTMMLIKLAFVATPKIKQLFCVIRFSLWFFLSGLWCQLDWQSRRKRYMKRLSVKAEMENWGTKWGKWWWWIFFVVWLTSGRRFALFLAETIVKDPHHLESPTHCVQDLNLHRTWAQAFLNEVVQ